MADSGKEVFLKIQIFFNATQKNCSFFYNEKSRSVFIKKDKNVFSFDVQTGKKVIVGKAIAQGIYPKEFQ